MWFIERYDTSNAQKLLDQFNSLTDSYERILRHKESRLSIDEIRQWQTEAKTEWERLEKFIKEIDKVILNIETEYNKETDEYKKKSFLAKLFETPPSKYLKDSKIEGLKNQKEYLVSFHNRLTDRDFLLEIRIYDEQINKELLTMYLGKYFGDQKK